MLGDKVTLRAETAFFEEMDLMKQFIEELLNMGKGQWSLQIGDKKKICPKAAPKKRARGRPKAAKHVWLEPKDGNQRSVLWDFFQKIRSLDRDGEAGVGHASLSVGVKV